MFKLNRVAVLAALMVLATGCATATPRMTWWQERMPEDRKVVAVREVDATGGPKKELVEHEKKFPWLVEFFRKLVQRPITAEEREHLGTLF